MRFSCGRGYSSTVCESSYHGLQSWLIVHGFDCIEFRIHLICCPMAHCPISFSPSDGFSSTDNTHSACVRMCEHTFLSPIKTVTSSLTLWLYAVNDASSILNHFLGNVKLFADCNTSFRADVQLWETCFKIVLKSFPVIPGKQYGDWISLLFQMYVMQRFQFWNNRTCLLGNHRVFLETVHPF